MSQVASSVGREDNSSAVGFVLQASRSRAMEVARGMGWGLIGHVRMQACGRKTAEMGREAGGAMTVGCEESGSSASAGRSLSSTTSMQ